MNDDVKLLLQKVEVKRVGEKVSKKELCNIYGFHYNFYMNCLNGRNVPSKNMVEGFNKYLETGTEDVHKLVFKSREVEEKFHPALGIGEKELKAIKKKLKSNGYYEEPTA